MKRLMTCAVLLALATAIAGCGASGSSSSAGAAASVAAATNAVATAPAGATTAVGTAPAATQTSAPAAGGGTCKFLSASDAAALLANPGPVNVVVADAPSSTMTTCTWGNITTDGVLLIAQELKAAAPASEIKAAMLQSVIETIPGLGDGGGFETKTANAVTVVFIKGSTLISLTVSGTSVNADAVAAAAKKIADGI
ncbi:MAG TPA: hypothetical protein VJ258_04145 [Candidatus Limnocylindrales bacterium]|nr:hypothetical protein [Candidatus Limnocylindrales bacterium]